MSGSDPHGKSTISIIAARYHKAKCSAELNKKIPDFGCCYYYYHCYYYHHHHHYYYYSSSSSNRNFMLLNAETCYAYSISTSEQVRCVSMAAIHIQHKHNCTPPVTKRPMIYCPLGSIYANTVQDGTLL
jgi:hypothetical protein